jgi:hypothetical protein
MTVLNIRSTGTAGIRVIVDERLPNGEKYLDLYVHYSAKNQMEQMDSAIIVKKLLADLLPAF